MKTNHELKLYLLSIFIGECSRTMPHAFSTLYLINNGFSLSQIALAPIAYMAAIILFEVPSGVFSDMYSRKILYYISNFFLGVSYLIYLFFPSFSWILGAQFLYGISTAFQTGTLDSLMLEKLNKENEPDNKIELFIRNESLVLNIAMIVGALSGSFLYYYVVGKYVYLAAFFGFIISSVAGQRITEKASKHILDKRNNLWKEFKIHLMSGLKNIIYNKKILYYISCLGMMQFILQPYFNYWQPIFQKKGISYKYFSMLYLFMQFLSVAASYLYKYLSNCKKSLTVVLILLTGGTILLSFVFSNAGFFLVFFLLSVLPRQIMLIKLNASFQKSINDEVRSTITSVSSMTSRIFSSGILSLMGILGILSEDACFIMAICSLLFIICSLTLNTMKKVIDTSAL